MLSPLSLSLSLSLSPFLCLTHLNPSMYLRVVGAMSARMGLSFPGGGASLVKRWSGWRTPFSSLSRSFSSYLTQLFLFFSFC